MGEAVVVIGVGLGCTVLTLVIVGVVLHERIARLERWINDFEDWQRGHTHHLAPPPPPPWETDTGRRMRT